MHRREINFQTLLFICLMVSSALSQETWSKIYGSSDRDFLTSIHLIDSSHTISIGMRETGGNLDYNGWAINIDMQGNTVWENVDLGPGLIYAGTLTVDNSVIAVGRAQSTPGNPNVWAIKIGGSGDLIWSREYDFGVEEEATSITSFADGDYLISGFLKNGDSNETKGIALKINSEGNELWRNSYGSTGEERIYGCIQHSSMDLLFVGKTDGGGWLLRTDEAGDSLAATIINNHWVINDISESNDGNLILAGSGLLKMDENGDLIWTIPHPGHCLNSLSVSPGGTITAVGWKDFSEEFRDQGWALQVNGDGIPIWEHVWGGYRHDGLNHIISTENEGFFFCGFSGSYGNGSLDGWVIKADSEGNTTPTVNITEPIVPNAEILKCFPNPFNSVVTVQVTLPHESSIKLLLLNQLGQIIYSKQYQNIGMRVRSFPINFHEMGNIKASGLYILVLKTDHSIQSKKVLFLK